MTKQNIDMMKLEDNAESLYDFIVASDTTTNGQANVIYVKDEDGNLFSHVILQEEVLTDGSKVYNMILIRDRVDEYSKT